MNHIKGTEDQLRSEIESLKQQLEEQKKLMQTARTGGPRPSRWCSSR